MTATLLLLVCYDISHTRRRNRVHRLLKSYGEPIQESVFEVLATEAQWQALKPRLLALLAPGDRLRSYFLCAACRRRADGTPGHPFAEKPDCIIL